jgi:hypothetical protein
MFSSLARIKVTVQAQCMNSNHSFKKLKNKFGEFMIMIVLPRARISRDRGTVQSALKPFTNGYFRYRYTLKNNTFTFFMRKNLQYVYVCNTVA